MAVSYCQAQVQVQVPGLLQIRSGRSKDKGQRHRGYTLNLVCHSPLTHHHPPRKLSWHSGQHSG